MRKVFHWYGGMVAKCPIPFVVVPVVLALIFCGGFVFMTRETDVEYLFTPGNSAARKDQSRLHEDFKSKTEFNPSRSLDQLIVAQVILTPKSGNNMWEQDIMDDVFQIDSDITAINASSSGTIITYEDVCMKESTGTCIDNGLSFVNLTMSIGYPYHEVQIPLGDPIKVFYGHMLGDVLTNSYGSVTNVSAIRLTYFLKENEASMKWSKAFVDTVLDFEYGSFHIELWTYYSVEFELAKNTD